MKPFYFFLLTVCFTSAHAQYAPQAGLPGSDAISASSTLFTSWATNCTVQRGPMNIADPSLGYASSGDSSLAIGPADGSVVSLGDSGRADLTFSGPIYNGPGPDFAVFENGFLDLADSTQAFLELAFVEVSSDGINYFRFPATSLTQTQTQVGNGDYLVASRLNNLAGKYIGGYGTPFDLDELSGITGLDVNHITHVRLVDVVGSVSGHSSHDSAGRIINDPYPTPFPSCGFDLDAVGVLHGAVVSGIATQQDNVSITAFPNPVEDELLLHINNGSGRNMSVTLTNIAGVVLQHCSFTGDGYQFAMGAFPSGMYYLVLTDNSGNRWAEKIIKR